MFIATTGDYGNNGVGIIQTKEEAEQAAQTKLYQDSGGYAIYKLANELGITLNDQTKDYLYQYYLNEMSRKNAWNDSVFAAQNQYQWLVNDLKKAGLNPFLAISGMNAAGATSTAQSSSGGLITSKSNNQDTNTTNMIKAALTAIASIIGLMLFKK